MINKKILLVGIIILLVLFSSNQGTTDEKKEGFTMYTVIFIIIGALLLIGPLSTYVLGAAITQPIFLVGIGLLIMGVFGLFRSVPSIPPIAYIIGFAVLIFMRKK